MEFQSGSKLAAMRLSFRLSVTSICLRLFGYNTVLALGGDNGLQILYPNILNFGVRGMTV
jgi:hypothetical protein